MLTLNDIHKQFGEKILFKKIHLSIGQGEVCGLVGENGTGKTTLLRIMAAEILPDTGSIDIQNEVIGYLPQTPEFSKGVTVNQFLYSKIAREDEKYKADIVLNEVELDTIDRTMEATRLSGGQKTRLYLASLLLSDPEPTILLLDEPTNNLDIEGIDWLEQFLTSFKGGVVLTSHDRSLLDNVVDTILEVSDQAIAKYGGNYSFYREQKEIEREAYERRYSAQQKQIKRIAEDIEHMKVRARAGEVTFSSRMPYQRAKIRKSAQQAVHRQKKLEKFLESEQKLEKPEEKIRHSIRLSGEVHSDKSIIFVKNISKAYKDKKVLKDISFHISGREHVWLAGLNGSGKTTLLSILNDEIKPDKGEIEIGNNIRIGYFSQDRNDLDEQETILSELMKLNISQTEAYKLALRYNFETEELNTKISTLSTGQKAKVAFAKLTTGNYQLLILDEPTNHLEISTRELIEDALYAYNGALLVSSHDRFFLERIGVDRIVVLKEGTIVSNDAQL